MACILLPLLFLQMSCFSGALQQQSLEDSKFVKPYPARPTPLPEIPPIHSSIGYSSPATVPKIPSPLSPASPSVSLSPPPPVSDSPPPPVSDSPPPPVSCSPPPVSYSRPPQSPPFTEPDPSPPLSSPPPFTEPASPQTRSSPPCNCIPNPVPVAPTLPKASESSGLWCVAKPSVPAETLQVGMDYACGQGGADCEEIKPYGYCFFPDTVVAHASYAYNSYWQKHKKLGGSCSFGETAMLINADPSFMHCRFILS